MKEISASFLCDKDEEKMIKEFNNSTCDYIHFDVMDGKFVEEKFITPNALPKLLNISKKKNDVHLMVKEPDKYIDKIALYDISYLTVHYEIKSLEETIDKIKMLGFKCGVSLKPETNIKEIFPYLKKIDLVLIMSVNPGKSGQKFIPETENKINILKEEINKQGTNTKIEVDGGINEETRQFVEEADILVSGSFIQKDLKNIDLLR